MTATQPNESVRSLSVAAAMAVLVGSIAISPSSAQASVGICGTNDAPAAYVPTQICHCTETLQFVYPGTNTHTVTCDIDVGTPTTASPGVLFGVTEYGSSTHDYSFFGIDEEGSKWCCVVDHETNYPDMYIVASGSTENDYMSLETWGGLDEDVADSLGMYIQRVELHGLGGEDTLVGNTASNAPDDQYFYGGTSDDTISMGGANSFAYGGWGDDTINGRKGAYITIYGDLGTGSSIGGDDVINATNAGNVSNAVIFGEAGNDTVCGSDGNDVLYGDAGVDVVWGGDATGIDQLYGGGALADQCGASGAYTSSGCNTLATKPGACNN